MKKSLLWITILIICISMVAVFSLAGCKTTTAAVTTAAATTATAETTTAAETTVAETSTASTTPKLSGQITFWMQKYGSDTKTQQDFLDKMSADFQSKYGVTVKTSLIDWGQALTKYTLASTGGEAPDVAETFFAYSQVKMGGEKYGPMIIDDLVNANGGFDNYFDFAKPECYINGHWYALPWRGDTRAMAYNSSDFKNADITDAPKTFDELIKDAQKLTVKDASGNVTHSGLVFFNSQSRFDQTWFVLLAGHGAKLMNDDYSKFTFFDDPKAKASLQFMQDCVYKYQVMPKDVINTSFSGIHLFEAGKASIVIGISPDSIETIKNESPQIAAVTKSVVMPNLTGSGVSSIAFAAPVVIYKTTKNPDAAKQFLLYFLSKDVQLQAGKAAGVISTHKDVAGDAMYTDDPWFKTFGEQSTIAQPGDMPLPEWSQIDAFPLGPINDMCTKIMAGVDVQKAMDDCKAAIAKILPDTVQ